MHHCATVNMYASVTRIINYQTFLHTTMSAIKNLNHSHVPSTHPHTQPSTTTQTVIHTSSRTNTTELHISGKYLLGASDKHLNHNITQNWRLQVQSSTTANYETIQWHRTDSDQELQPDNANQAPQPVTIYIYTHMELSD